MSNIEEIRNRLAEAKTATRVAMEAERAIAAELQSAINADSGLVGHVLEFTVKRGFGKSERILSKRILVDRIRDGWREPEAHGYYILANGSVGKMRGSVELAQAKDIGPFASQPLPSKGGGE